jgi:hypothetical protein
LEVGTEQSFPLVVNKGNGPDSHSLGWIHSLQVALCLVPEEWPRVGGLGSAIRDRHSLGKIHSLQVTLCLVSEEWPKGEEWSRLRNQNNHSSLFEKNKPDSPSLMFYSEGIYSFKSHRCE